MYKSTIVVSPRERFSSVIPSLKSIFNTVDDSVPVIVVEGVTPTEIRAEIKALQSERPFKHIALSYPVTPNEARNIGAAEVETEFVLFADNDIEYEAGWLEALERNADENDADAVAPLIFIGPCETVTIHHAGGKLHHERDGANLILSEQHRFMNVPLEEVEAQLSDPSMLENEVCEFHCMLMRKDLYDRMGGLDERLITREQMDFALRCMDMGTKVTFEKDSRVTYRAYDPFNSVDLQYHLFRWSDERAVESIKAFEETWGVKLKADRIRYSWIQNHRDRAIATVYPWPRKVLGRKFMRRLISQKIERRVREQFDMKRAKLGEKSIPNRPEVVWAGTLFGLDDGRSGSQA
ncbi:hypothetical protein BOW53_07085 [Solemya pervernicosa gill symbiont]|uniref:Glycosyltransferase 2-like domain-containing protein n=2 Tax=Gammaproteobacteria incertae sedis TaxID=118884 RepID=A0A1T2L677_9GAMM|nr:glycosyltransferase [Candidatus Reidiella endopervernicosa]OOZ40609.1 hypothetical protein BOW53_07085 [Solemya pervernicosa gill symbiont]QKQ26630.1 glycosyltransferase [Candidatus Reidiella endopervernicosa]